MSCLINNLPWTCVQAEYLNRETWLESRKRGIGASESASIFGVGYKGSSPLTVWYDKIGRDDDPIESDAGLSALIRRGQRMEPVIAAEFADETGFELLDPGDYTIFISTNPELEFLFATLDRIAVHPEHGPIPAEIKNVSGRLWRDWEDDSELPLKHVIQCQHQMAVTGAEFCVLVALIGGNDLKYRLIERDQSFIDVMVIKLREFWGYVRRGELPPVDESEATSKLLGELYPDDDQSLVVLPDDAIEWHRELIEAKQAISEAKKRKTAAENKLKAAIGSATFGETETGIRYSWKQQTRAEHVVKESTFRVLRGPSV